MKKILLVMLCAAAVFTVSQAAPKRNAQTYEKNRLELIKPVKKGVLQLRPTFNSCGFYFGSSKVKSPVLEYRKSGSGKWLAAFTPVHFFENKNTRQNTDGQTHLPECLNETDIGNEFHCQ